MKTFPYLIFLLLFPILSCSDKQKIDQDTMVKVYVETLIAKDTLNNSSTSFAKEKLKIFNKYGITDSAYSYTLRSYREDKELWDEFFKKSFDYLDSLRTYYNVK